MRELLELQKISGYSKDTVSNTARCALPMSPVVTPGPREHDELLYMFREGLSSDHSSAIVLRAYHNKLTGALFPLCEKSLIAITAFSEFTKQSDK
jgi:hypothetical protein